MNAIDNLNTKSVQQIINDVSERFADDGAWGRLNLGDRHGCLCLLGAVSVAEGIVTVADYIDYNERVREYNAHLTVADYLDRIHEDNIDNMRVGEFSDQAKIYVALDKSEAVIALAQAIAKVNPFLAEAYARYPDKPTAIVYMFNDAQDTGFISTHNYNDRDELAYGRVMKLLHNLKKTLDA